MWLISSRKDEGLIEHLQYEYHYCSSFLIEEAMLQLPLYANRPHFPLFINSVPIYLIPAHTNSKS